MVDYRVSGHINTNGKRYSVDFRFRTDAINATDNKFNILQVSVGSGFIGDNTAVDNVVNTDSNYLRFFSGYVDPTAKKYVFQRQESSLGHMITFCMNYGLDLRQYVGNAKGTYIVVDSSHSISALG